MDIDKIIETLSEKFAEKDDYQRKIIFWEDVDKDFINDWQEVTIPNVKSLELKPNNQFQLKYILEKKDKDSDYLIYTNMDLLNEDYSRNRVPKNWLLDTVLYSYVFRANRVDLVMDDMNINQGLKPVMEKYKDFFRNKIRIKQFKTYGPKNSKEKIELDILSTLCNTSISDLNEVLRKILMEGLEDEENKYIEEIKKYFSLERFWDLINKEYGFSHENKNLKNLLAYLLLTTFNAQCDIDLSRYEQLINENQVYVVNVKFFISNWQSNQDDYKKLDQYCHEYEQKLNLKDLFLDRPVRDYLYASTFPMIDRVIINRIKSNLIDNIEEYENYISIIRARRDLHFYKDYKIDYAIIYYAIKLNQFEKAHNSFYAKTAKDLFTAYMSDYYQADQYYRKFYFYLDQKDSDINYRELTEKIENYYTNTFLLELASSWDRILETELNTHWIIKGVINQQDFYQYKVTKDKVKKFIIISDALRYEVAEELAQVIRQEDELEVETDAILGVLPSITKLGMSALMPHKSLEFREDAYVYVDGQKVTNQSGRIEYINNYSENAKAYSYEGFMNTERDQRREEIKNKDFIYIYHDRIDRIADTAANQDDVFEAAAETIDELEKLVKKLKGDHSASQIFITADHGFLYQRSPIADANKLDNQLPNIIEAKRRYTVADTERELDGQMRFDLENTLKSKSNNLPVYVPRLILRNRAQGAGDKFVHGGASLQEIVVPLLDCKYKRGKEAKVQRKVDLKLITERRRITNPSFTLKFFQEDAINEQIIPRTVEIYFINEHEREISTRKRITLDNKGQDRQIDLKFDINPSKSKEAILIAQDVDSLNYVLKEEFDLDLTANDPYRFFG